eukprot:scaffold3084_cov144-Cylindrotheca_fusiformis.AAC.12
MEIPLDAQREFYGHGKGPPMLVDDPHDFQSSRRKRRKRRKTSKMNSMTADQLLASVKKHQRSTPSPSTLPGDFPQPYAYRSLAVYALLRTLSVQLRLSPFTPNVFLRALYLPYPNNLLGDVHVSLLRILLATLKLGYAYKEKGSSISYHKRRTVDSIKIPLKGGDNLTFLDGCTWPLFYDDYCHLTADRLWAALNDEEDHVDFRNLGLQSLGMSDYADEQFANETQRPDSMHYTKFARANPSESNEQDAHDESDSDYTLDQEEEGEDDPKEARRNSKVLDLEGTFSHTESKHLFEKRAFSNGKRRSLILPTKSKVAEVSSVPSQKVVQSLRGDTSSKERSTTTPRYRGRLLPLHKDRNTPSRKRPLDNDETSQAMSISHPQTFTIQSSDTMPGKPFRVDDDVIKDLRTFLSGDTVPPPITEMETVENDFGIEYDSEATVTARHKVCNWPQFEPLKMLRSGVPYHRLSIAHKLDMLEFLIDELLNLGPIAEEFATRQAVSETSPFLYGVLPTKSEFDNLTNEDECGVCGLEGELLCCDGCICSFHRACIDMSPAETLPDGEWLCPECKVVDPSKFGSLRGGRKSSVDWFHVGEVANVLKAHEDVSNVLEFKEEMTADLQVGTGSTLSNQVESLAHSHVSLKSLPLASPEPIELANVSEQNVHSSQPEVFRTQPNGLPINGVVGKLPISNQARSKSEIQAVSRYGANVQAPPPLERKGPSPCYTNGASPGFISTIERSNSPEETLAVSKVATQATPGNCEGRDGSTNAGRSAVGYEATPVLPPSSSGTIANNVIGESSLLKNQQASSTRDSMLPHKEQSSLDDYSSIDANAAIPKSLKTNSSNLDKNLALNEFEFLIVHGFAFCRKHSQPCSRPYTTMTEQQLCTCLKGIGELRNAWPFVQIPTGESYDGRHFLSVRDYFRAFEAFNPSFYVNKYRKAPVPIVFKAGGGKEMPSLMLASYESECNSSATYKLSETLLRDMAFDKQLADSLKSERSLFNPYALVTGYMLKLDATLRKACLLNEFWESGKVRAAHEVWSSNVMKCRSVSKLSKLLLKLVDQMHPRAFLDGWFHNTQLKKAETLVGSERYYEQLPENWNAKKELRKRRWERTPSTMILSLCAKEDCPLEFFVQGIRPEIGMQATAVRSKRKKTKSSVPWSTNILPNRDASNDHANLKSSISTNNTSANGEERDSKAIPIGLQPTFVDVSDIERPQKPYPAYFQFANRRRLEMKEKNPNASSTDISKILSNVWKSSSDEFRERFSKEEMKQREEYKEAMEEYHKKVEERYVAMGVTYPGRQLAGKIGQQAFDNLAIDASNEDIDHGRGSIRRSRRSGRFARNSVDTDNQAPASSSINTLATGKVPSDSLELQVEQCKLGHIKPIEKLVKSATQKEQFWPLAGRIPFETAGDLPPSTMRRLGRNAGAAKAPHVAYSTSHEVAQVCCAHLWRKRTDNCSTFEDLLYQARVLESFLDRQAIHSFEGAARRGKSQFQKEVRCSQTDPDSGVVYHFVVNKKSRKGCWIAEDSMDVSCLTLELFTRKQKQISLRQARVEAAQKIEREKLLKLRAENERSKLLAAEAARRQALAKQKTAADVRLAATLEQKSGNLKTAPPPSQRSNLVAAEATKHQALTSSKGASENRLPAVSEQNGFNFATAPPISHIGFADVNKQIQNAVEQHGKDVKQMLEALVRIRVLPTEANIKALRQKNVLALRAAAEQLKRLTPPIVLTEHNLWEMLKEREKAVAGKPLETFARVGAAQQGTINSHSLANTSAVHQADATTRVPRSDPAPGRSNPARVTSQHPEYAPNEDSLGVFSPTPIADCLHRKRSSGYDLSEIVWSDMEDFDITHGSGTPDNNVSNRSQPPIDPRVPQNTGTVGQNSFSQPKPVPINQPNTNPRQGQFSLPQFQRSNPLNQGNSFQRRQAQIHIPNGYNTPSIGQHGMRQQREQALMNSHYAKNVQDNQSSQPLSQRMVQQLQQQLQPSQHIMMQRQLQQQMQQASLSNTIPHQHPGSQPQFVGQSQALFQQRHQQQPWVPQPPQQGFFQQQPNQQIQQLQGWMSGNPFSQS